MTKEDRHCAILEQLSLREMVSVLDLSRLVNVSEVTIRKDLTELEKMGKLYRSHGGARKANPFALNRSVVEKEQIANLEKEAIAREAVKLVTPNDSIALASGTTIHAFARQLHPQERLTVVSASLPASQILAQDRLIDIIQLGGILRHGSLSVVIEHVADRLHNYSFSKLFLGVDGIDLNYGITTTDIREASMNRQMMDVAQKVVVLADSSKFGRRGFAKINPIDSVDIIVTDSNISPTILSQLQEMGIDTIVANVDNVSK